MPTIEEQIKAIEEEIRKTDKNKATEHHISKLRAKVARLKDRQELARSKKTSRKTTFRKSGDATVAIVGFPNVGKSTLLNKLTGAKSEVGDYQFTTLDSIPGMMERHGARIQLVDLPGLIEDAASGRGRGKEVLSAVRSSDLVVIMVDSPSEDIGILLEELEKANIRLNKSPPNMSIKRKAMGGLTLTSTVPLKDRELLLEILREWGYVNADVVVREGLTPERLVDFLAGNRVYIPSLTVVNKMDALSGDDLRALKRKHPDGWPISAREGKGLEELKDRIFEKLCFIRVYLKPQGKEADKRAPLILRKGAKVEDVCRRLHRSFQEKFRYAQVWGRSAKFGGQMVGLEHALADEDVLTVVVKK